LTSRVFKTVGALSRIDAGFADGLSASFAAPFWAFMPKNSLRVSVDLSQARHAKSPDQSGLLHSFILRTADVPSKRPAHEALASPRLQIEYTITGRKKCIESFAKP